MYGHGVTLCKQVYPFGACGSAESLVALVVASGAVGVGPA